MSSRWFCKLALAVYWLTGASSAAALPILSEVFYDAVGSDNGQSFVEIYGTPGTDLTGIVLEGINGSDGSVTGSIVLAGVVPADALFVVADDQGDGSSSVLEADQIANFDFQNGPDSVRLRSAETVLDSLGYGEFTAGEVFAGEGAPAPDAPAGSSLARAFANLDSDDNASDFSVQSDPSPGAAPLALAEPSALAMLSLALLGLARAGRRRA